jgi:RHS repeat-associated protein
MPGRTFASDDYRYGFNGKENDREWGESLIQDYGMRLYNPALCRFLSVDPISDKFVSLSPYQFAANSCIALIDLDGLEPASDAAFKRATDAVLQFSNNPDIAADIGAFIMIDKQGLANHLMNRLSAKGGNMNSPFYSCAPTAACYNLLLHDPEQYVKIFIELWTNGKANNGKIVASTELKKLTYPEDDMGNTLDMALIGSLRNAANLILPYEAAPQAKKETDKMLDEKLKNSTPSWQFKEIMERTGANVKVTQIGQNDVFSALSKGQRVVLYGYYGKFHTGDSGSDPNDRSIVEAMGGDHFITVSSIKEQANGSVTLRYWDHGEMSSEAPVNGKILDAMQSTSDGMMREVNFKSSSDLFKSFTKGYKITNNAKN